MDQKHHVSGTYCLQRDAMPQGVRDQIAEFSARFSNSMLRLNPPVKVQCEMRVDVGVIRFPSNEVCNTRMHEFLESNRKHYTALHFVPAPGALSISQRPPEFRAPWWLKLLLMINVMVLFFAYFIAADRLTFL